MVIINITDLDKREILDALDYAILNKSDEVDSFYDIPLFVNKNTYNHLKKLGFVSFDNKNIPQKLSDFGCKYYEDEHLNDGEICIKQKK